MATLVGMPAPVNGCAHPKVLVDKALKETKKAHIPNGHHHTNGTNGVNGVHESSADDAFKIGSEYAYTPRRMKVITIGAGFSGLLMAHKFQHRFPEMRDIVDHQVRPNEIRVV